MIDGSKPLANGRYEAFAQAVARVGRGGAARAYRQHVSRTTSGITDDSAKSAAYQYARKPEIAARIAFLRGANAAVVADISGPLTAEAVAGVLREVTDTLGALHTVAAERGEDPTVVLRLRRVLSSHSGRLSGVEGQSTQSLHLPAPALAPGGAPTLRPLPAVPDCQCLPSAPQERA